MKKTIKGITYDTEKAESISGSLTFNGLESELFKARPHNFFVFKRRFKVDGKNIPIHKTTSELLPDLDHPKLARREKARVRVSVSETITPLTRRQAIAWCIRNQMPRTFHKDLARFLK